MHTVCNVITNRRIYATIKYQPKNNKLSMTHSREIHTLHSSRYITCIIYVSLCIFATIDTGLFVYSSLSRSLLMEAGITLLDFVCVSFSILRRDSLPVSRYTIFVLTWAAYVMLHAIIVTPHEIYRTLYLSITLLMIPVINACIKTGLLSRRNIEDGLVLIAVIHIIFIVAQWLGVSDSGNVFFPVTGSNDDPTVTALYLAGVMPLLLVRFWNAERHYWYMLLVISALVCITTLHCRTAYIGLAVEAVVCLFMLYGDKLPKSASHPLRLCFVTVLVVVMAVAAGHRLYSMKKDSADGRLLIWRLSAEMIVDKPLGHGYGQFEKCYNLRQVDYFSQGGFTDAERRNADFVYMPYNDYLEHGVEGGAIGMMLLVVFYVVNVRKAWKDRKVREAAVLTAFAVMSLTNFVYTSIQPWLLVMCCSALIMSDDKEEMSQHNHIRTTRTVNALALTLLLIAAYPLVNMLRAQLALKSIDNAMEAEGGVDDSRFAAMERPVATSEAYWCLRAKNSMAQGNYADATAYIRNARQYSSAPELLYMEAGCQQETGNMEAGMCLIDTMSNMLPHMLRPKQILMRYNASLGNRDEALRHADDIISTGAKIDNGTAREIIKEAKQYKDMYGR